jgi:hypothetical protein
MALYERLIGLGARPKIPVHQFQALAAEWAWGKLTAAEANALVAECSQGVPLDAGEQAEAQALIATVTSIAISGSATAQADARARRAMRMHEIDRCFLLAEHQLSGYNTVAGLKAKLGVV